MTALKHHIGFRYTRNGGMRFLRVGRLQFSFCVCRGRIER